MSCIQLLQMGRAALQQQLRKRLQLCTLCCVIWRPSRAWDSAKRRTQWQSRCGSSAPSHRPQVRPCRRARGQGHVLQAASTENTMLTRCAPPAATTVQHQVILPRRSLTPVFCSRSAAGSTARGPALRGARTAAAAGSAGSGGGGSAGTAAAPSRAAPAAVAAGGAASPPGVPLTLLPAPARLTHKVSVRIVMWHCTPMLCAC